MSSPRAILTTNLGDITIELFPDTAPKAVENFIGLIKKDYYKGVIFHRVIPDFMIQWGDPTGTGRGGKSIWMRNFEDEISGKHTHKRGTLSMANAGKNTNGSQFFIVTADDASFLDSKHTIFGQVVEGMDVVEAIEMTPCDRDDRPLSDMIIIRASIVE